MGRRLWVAGLASGAVAGMAALAWWAWTPAPADAPGAARVFQLAPPGSDHAASAPSSVVTSAGARAGSAASVQADALVGRQAGTAPRASAPATGAPPAASAGASSRLADRLTTGRNIGSEGYGPYIREALEAADPDMAMLAVQRIFSCSINPEFQAGHERLKSDPRLPPHLVAESIEHYRADERRCQTLTPEIAALRPKLALKAMQGGAIGGAVAYVHAANFQLPDDLRAPVLAALQRDAQAGDRGALMTLSQPSLFPELTAFERRVFTLAEHALESGTHLGELLNWIRNFHAGPGLTETDEARAQAAAKALVEKIRAAEPKRP